MLVEIETDKVVLEVPASADGILDAVLEMRYNGNVVRSLVACVKATAPVKKPAPNLKRKRPLRRNASRRLWKSKPRVKPGDPSPAGQHNLDASAIKGTGVGGRLTRERCGKTSGESPGERVCSGSGTCSGSATGSGCT
ncbi:hypothetical protein ACLB1R_15465 [Escherichia coli]